MDFPYTSEGVEMSEQKPVGRINYVDHRYGGAGLAYCLNSLGSLPMGAPIYAEPVELVGMQEEITQLRHDKDLLQSLIDSLMLEYCPDEMTEAQKARWAECQHPVSAEVQQTVIDAAKG